MSIPSNCSNRQLFYPKKFFILNCRLISRIMICSPISIQTDKQSGFWTNYNSSTGCVSETIQCELLGISCWFQRLLHDWSYVFRIIHHLFIQIAPSLFVLTTSFIQVPQIWHYHLVINPKSISKVFIWKSTSQIFLRYD